MPDRAFLSALTESAAGEWAAILSLVFGGCCSNVWALEAVLKTYPSSGTFLTFAQFIYVAVQTVWTQFYFVPGSRLPRWRKNVVPLSRWMVQVVLFFAVSFMNNYAFGLKIPVTVHIIFRSGGLCVSMLVGYFAGGKRYSTGQMFAGAIITAGIVLATISAPRPRKAPTPAAATVASDEFLPENVQYIAGIGLLALALLLSAWLGLWQEATYKQYGKQWREALFYCHVLSLPFFLPMSGTISRTFDAYMASAPVTLATIPTPDMTLLSTTTFSQLSTLAWPVDDAKRHLIQWRQLAVPGAILALLVNVITQGLCIRGVNRLTTRVSSTTVNLILTLRKAASLAISVWFYGSGVSWGLAIGGAMVLGGTLVYSVAPPPKVMEGKVDEKKVDDDEKVNGGSERATDADGSSTAVDHSSANGNGLRQR